MIFKMCLHFWSQNWSSGQDHWTIQGRGWCSVLIQGLLFLEYQFCLWG